jgi:tetratricopeptide (TPR) repeat protein
MKRLSAGSVILVFWLVASGFALAQTDQDELRFIEGLRQRRQFHLAEFYCRDRLDNASLPATRRTDLTLELIRCYAAEAVEVPSDQSQPLWEKARETAAQFLRQHPTDPRLVLVRVQDALTVLARGELYRQESEVLAQPAEATEAARTHLREAARLLNQLHDEIAREIPLRHRTSATAGQLTADELISLQHHVQFQLARVYRNRALSYPPDSEDRLAALTAAVDQLQRPLAQIADNDPLIWPVRLDLAVCLRLLGRWTEAEEILQAIQESDVAGEIVWRARAEQVRLNLDRHQPEQALAVFPSERPPTGLAAADLDFAYLETCLALWQAARDGDGTAADTWRNRAADLVRSIEQMHGPYWGRRGDLLLVRTIGVTRAGGHVQILSRAADGLYRQGQWADAISAYEQAGAEALAAGQTGQGFELRYKAALVDHSRQQHESASQRLRRLALELPDQAAAPDVHLLAAWNTAQLARSQPEALKRYAQMLEEHLGQWPTATTADAARLWLGRLRETQEQWQAAAQAFQGVSRQHDEHPAAWRSAARCWNQALRAARDNQSLDEAVVHAAAEGFWQHTPDGSQDPDRPWTTTDRYCAQQAARLLIAFTSDGYARAEMILRAALDGSPAPDDSWRALAEALWMVTLAGQPSRRSQAEEQFAALQGQSPDSLWEVLIGVHRLLSDGEIQPQPVPGQTDPMPAPDAGRQLAELQIAVADRLWPQREHLDPARRTVLQRIRAEAFLAAGHRGQALTAYAELASNHPDDGPIQQAYARLLLDSESREAWQQGLDVWRRIATRHRPGSEGWYQARYAIAAALIQLGQHDEAASRIRYLQALPPGLEGSPWQAKFQKLLEQCGSPVP